MADPPPYIRAVAVFQYGGELAQAIYQLKYRNQLFLARPLGTLMAGHLHALAPDLVVPVPLHRRRLNQRGYNQAAELAKFAARKIAIPVAPTLAVRVHDTPAQVSLSLSQRKTLNADSFSVKKKKKLKGKHIVVLDDVYTTGTTTRAVTRALLRDGARAVSVLTLAKSVH
jgi:ComF family protein